MKKIPSNLLYCITQIQINQNDLQTENNEHTIQILDFLKHKETIGIFRI